MIHRSNRLQSISQKVSLLEILLYSVSSILNSVLSRQANLLHHESPAPHFSTQPCNWLIRSIYIVTQPKKTNTRKMSGDFTAFFYGTLMAPEVFFTVCYGDRDPPKAIKDMHTFTPAILDGYCRHKVECADYPAVVPEKGHSVLGIYATGLTDGNVDKLDMFEGSEYFKEKVKVKVLNKDGTTPEKEETKETFVYVFDNPDYLEKGEWDFEEFRKSKMKNWTRAGLGFGEDIPKGTGNNGWE